MPRSSRLRISFLVSAFTDQVDRDIEKPVLLEHASGGSFRPLSYPFKQLWIGHSLPFRNESADFLEI
jgi:hypothetical protein